MEGVVDIRADGSASSPKEFGFFHGDDSPSVGNVSRSAGTVAADGATADIDGASRQEPGLEIRNAGDRDGNRVEMSLLPLKKRALMSDSRSCSSSPKMRRTDDCVGDGGALRIRLASLGATPPSFVYRKRLQMSDVCPNQNRLLVSCKRGGGAAENQLLPLLRRLSPAEKRRVDDKAVGLAVTALDRRGEAHALTCKFLGSNGAYRFISGWKRFLARNGLTLDGDGGWARDVEVELWAFRSPALPRQPRLDAKGKVVKGEEEADHLHPDGAIGLVLLHHERGEDGGEGALPLPESREKDVKLDKRDASLSSSAAKPMARGEAAAGATMSKAEMIAAYGKAMSLAVIGMLRLRGAMLGSGAGEGIERRRHGS